MVAADAAIDDGHLDLYSLEMRTVWKLALMLPSFRAGAHGAWSEVRTARGTEFEIRTAPAAPGQRRRRADRRDAGGLQRAPRRGDGLRAAPDARDAASVASCQTASASTRSDARRRAASRAGGAPKRRAYSRLNCDGLS